MKALHAVSFALVIVGSLNWLLIGAFNFNLVTQLFSAGTIASIIYILVGLAAIWLVISHQKDCKACACDKPAAAPTA